MRRRNVLIALVASLLGVAITAQVVSAAGDAASDTATYEGVSGERVVTWSADENLDALSVPAGANNVEYVALGTGCRIFDTRAAGGVFTSTESRDLSVLDTAVPGQGGNAGGCDIPSHALAVDLSLSTAGGSPSGPGYVRVGPGGTAPTATVLQFLTAQGTSVTTTTTLNSSSLMRIQVFGASTHLIGDVLGYWQRTLHATVNNNGTLQMGSGVDTVEKYNDLTGFYVITFERDISECSMTATPWQVGDPSARVRATLNGPVGEVFVYTQEYNSTTAKDTEFQLILEC